jgi:hypothetical protein
MRGKTYKIHYKVKGQRMQRQLREWELREHFMRAYRHNDSQVTAHKNVWGLVQAKRDFQRFLAKLRTTIFVIHVPEKVEVQNKDICDYYTMIAPTPEPTAVTGNFIFVKKSRNFKPDHY